MSRPRPRRGLNFLRSPGASIRARILIPTTLLFSLTIAVMALVAAFLQSKEVRHHNEQRLRLVANAVKNEMVIAMLEDAGERDHDEVFDSFQKALTTLEAETATTRIIDPQGLITFSSDPTIVGSRVSDPSSLPPELATLTGNEKDGFRLVQPVKNKPACKRCHDEEQKINGWIDVRVPTSPTTAPEWHQARIMLLITFPTLLALIGILWWLLGREVAKPLSRLTKAMKQAEDDMDVAVPDTDRSDGLGDAARCFDATLAALRRSQLEVEAVYRERMLRVDRFAAVGELTTGLAHEIKNPLAGMLGALEILEEDVGEPHAKVIVRLQEEVMRLSVVMDSTLNFARPSKLRLRATNLNEMMGKLEFSLRPHLRKGKKSISVCKDFEADLPQAYADPTPLSQALLNIALNAVQAMLEKGGQITLRTYAADGRIKLQISDTGPGIPEEARPHIFEPFFTTKNGGTGLGLALSARLIAEHGGDIDYSCPGSGGTQFTISLKRADARNKAPTSPPEVTGT